MIVVEYFGIFILLAVIVFASMPGKFYDWMVVKYTGRKRSSSRKTDGKETMTGERK